MSSNQPKPKKLLVKKKTKLNPNTSYKKVINIVTDSGKKKIEVIKDKNEIDESITYEGMVNNNEKDKHGYFLPPSTGRTIVIQKSRDKPLYVDKRFPLPPPLTEDQKDASNSMLEKLGGQEPTVRLPTIANIRAKRHVQKQNFQSYEEGVTEAAEVFKKRKLRKFISSLGKDGTPSSFTFKTAEPLKRIFKIKFVSVTLSYVVPISPPTNAFIYFDGFPLFENPSYYQTDLGTKYSAHFPLISGSVGSTINMNYAFPQDYEMYLTSSSDTVNSFNIKLFKEDPSVIPGDIIDFSDVTYATFEVEFYLEDLLL